MNPRAGNWRALKQWTRLLPAIEAVVSEYTLFQTEYAGHATVLAREALQNGYTRIVSCGGDGTHYEIVNGFFENGQPINPEASMTILPLGTGCDLGKSLDLPKPTDSVEYLANPDTVPMDVGKIICQTEEGETIERYYLIAAHTGLGGVVAIKTNKRTKALGGFLTFFLATFSARLDYSDPEMTVTIGEESFTQPFMDIAVANGEFDGGGMRIAPKTRLNNGQLEMYTFDKMNFWEVLCNAHHLYRGTLERHRAVRYFRSTYMKIESDSEVWVQADGEVVGLVPATFEVAPRSLKTVMGPKAPLI